MLKIVATKVVRIPKQLISRSIGTARNPNRERAGILLQLTDRHGNVGQGECSPLPHYSVERLDDCDRRLRAVRWEELDPIDFDKPLKEQLGHLFAQASVPYPAARFAIETAILDLVGQHLKRSVAALLVKDYQTELRNQVPLAAQIRAEEAHAAMAEIEDARRRGIRTIKLKLGKPGRWESELKLASAIHDTFGSEIAIRFDANQAFSADLVLERLDQLASFRPEFVEEPLAGGLLDANLLTDVGIAADESLRHPNPLPGLESLIQQGRLRALILKPMLLGGAFVCMDLAQRVCSRGVAVVVTHLWDGPIALAACYQLARAIPGTLLPSGLDRHAGLGAWPASLFPQLRCEEMILPR